MSNSVHPRTVVSSRENVRCYINPGWKEMGHARVAISRQGGTTDSGAIFLVDLFCLGVKDVMGGFRSIKEFETMLSGVYFDHRPDVIAIGLARDIVWGAVHYARSLGFEPHPDFRAAQSLLGAAVVPRGNIRFGGPNGKPLYVVGPDDRAEEIVRKLEERVGKDGFEVILPG